MPGRKKILQILKTIFQQKEFEESPLPLPLPSTTTSLKSSSSSKARIPRKLPPPPPSIKMYSLKAYTAGPQKKLEDLKVSTTTKKKTGK